VFSGGMAGCYAVSGLTQTTSTPVFVCTFCDFNIYCKQTTEMRLLFRRFLTQVADLHKHLLIVPTCR
jgi:hypothetical protein